MKLPTQGCKNMDLSFLIPQSYSIFEKCLKSIDGYNINLLNLAFLKNKVNVKCLPHGQLIVYDWGINKINNSQNSDLTIERSMETLVKEIKVQIDNLEKNKEENKKLKAGIQNRQSRLQREKELQKFFSIDNESPKLIRDQYFRLKDIFGRPIPIKQQDTFQNFQNEENSFKQNNKLNSQWFCILNNTVNEKQSITQGKTKEDSQFSLNYYQMRALSFNFTLIIFVAILYIFTNFYSKLYPAFKTGTIIYTLYAFALILLLNGIRIINPLNFISLKKVFSFFFINKVKEEKKAALSVKDISVANTKILNSILNKPT